MLPPKRDDGKLKIVIYGNMMEQVQRAVL